MISKKGQNTQLYGLSAEFESPEALLDAAKKAREAGYNDVKAFSPFPVHGIDDVLGNKSSSLSWIVLIAIIVGVVTAFSLQYITSVNHYPLNVGGRPLFVWPAFIPITFEFAILFGGLATVIYLFVMTGLPLPYHPIFNAEGAEEASRSRFFLVVETTDGKFHTQETRDFLAGLDPINVSEVAA